MGLLKTRMMRSPVLLMFGFLSCLCGCEHSCSTMSTVVGYTIVIIVYLLLAVALVAVANAIGVFINILLLTWVLSSSLPLTQPALYIAGLMDGAECGSEIIQISTRQVPKESTAVSVGVSGPAPIENSGADDEGMSAKALGTPPAPASTGGTEITRRWGNEPDPALPTRKESGIDRAWSMPTAPIAAPTVGGKAR